MKLPIIILVGTLMITGGCMFARRHSHHKTTSAPDFTLPDQDGKPVHLDDIIKNSHTTILIFYPKDGSPLCTQQLCAVQDTLFEDAQKHKVTILAISGNTPADHKTFSQAHHFRFPLLSDLEGRVRKLYHAYSFFSQRATIIINHAGMIVDRCDDFISLKGHLEKIHHAIDASRHA